MAALMTNTGLNEYVSNELARPPAIVQPACGPSPLGSDPNQDFVASISEVLDRVEGGLLDWYRDPERYADDETDEPSRAAIRTAMKCLQQYKADLTRMPGGVHWLPLRAATIGSGGAISLEFARGGAAVTIRCRPDGSIERLVFADGRLRSRAPLRLTPS